MPITHPETGTRVDEIAPSIYRISVPVPPSAFPGGFTFNQFLILDDEPLLFHTGPRRMFPRVREAIGHVMDVARLRWIAFSHFEADECGALNELLAVAPHAAPVCSILGAAVSIGDVADRAPRPMADGEVLTIGARAVRWIDTPHVPHGMDCGYLFEESTATLLCGDLLAQPGAGVAPLTEGDVLGPSEALRARFGYAKVTDVRRQIEGLAATNPTTLACMHGSAFRGDGAAVLRTLAKLLEGDAMREV
jgi:glyoxylase-like metal-dependent hydrolase (beta-lactamase superfamily II)